MKTKEEKIKQLKEIKSLFYQSYLLQNRAKVLLSDFFIIDNNSEYLNNDFFKIYEINTSTGLYESEIKTELLINKLYNNQ